MRPASKLELKVGLLIVGGLIATVVLVLLTDRIRFDSHYTVKAYISDAAGLRLGSPVTLDGIRVGEVENLAAVGDPRGNIQVLLRINQRHLIPLDSKLSIASSGIFGDSFLAFSGSSDPNPRMLPVDGMAEVQASRGFFDKAGQQAEAILAGVSDLMTGDTRGDIKRLVRGAADFAEAGARLANHLDEQSRALGETLASVKALSDELRTTVVELERRVDGTLARVDGLVVTVDRQAQELGSKAAASMGRIDDLTGRTGAVIDSAGPEVVRTLIAARGLAERVQRIADALASGEGVAGQLLVNRELARDLNHTAIDLSRTAALIADHPETLVFGMSKEESAAQAARREREKRRRSFHEGYGSGIPVVTAPATPAP
jgi:phospholipid/cholesterol/gamma-HCH transport system substrate-binding protein